MKSGSADEGRSFFGIQFPFESPKVAAERPLEAILPPGSQSRFGAFPSENGRGGRASKRSSYARFVPVKGHEAFGIEIPGRLKAGITIRTCMETLDQTDRKILDSLMKDASGGIPKLAKALGLPRSTVEYRVLRMRRRGIIKAIRAVPNYERIGRSVTAFVLVAGLPMPEGQERDHSKRILQLSGIDEVYVLAGEWDLILKIRASSIDDLRSKVEEVRGLRGIGRTLTCVVFKVARE